MTNSLPTRAELPVQDTWDLTTIYPIDQDWESAYAALPPLLEDLEKYQGKLGADAKTLFKAVSLRDDIGQRLSKLIVYAFLRRDEDTTNSTYQALADRAQQLATRASTAESFMRPELLTLPDGTIERFMKEEQGLQLYEHLFDDMLREKPHVLSQAEENLLAQSSEVGSAAGTIYGMLDNADLKFGIITDEEGQEIELTSGRYQRFIRSPKRDVRREAFTQYHNIYNSFRNTCAATFSANVKSDLFYSRARNYPSALEAALHPDNVPLSVYTNLIEAVHQNLPLLYRYLKIRQQALKVDELHMYDIHVPLLSDIADTVSYKDAKNTVLEALSPLGDEYVSAARKGFESRWVDVYETPNKRSGAYSWGSYDTNPFILMNYQDTLNDEFTLAHELGHTMHSYFTRKSQPYVYGDYTIFVAEVASTFNEALLTDYLLKHTDDPRTRLAIINNNLDTIRGTLYRQTMFAEFEKLTHEAAEAGQALTADSLSEIYFALNKQYHGTEVVTDDEIAIEWARIPHFYNSFYVYKYATGISAATALAQQVINDGPAAVQRYLRFLSRGSSAYSIDLLRDAGVDMASPEPVNETLKVFGTYLDEMEQLLAEVGMISPQKAGA